VYKRNQSWTCTGSIHGLDWIGLDWVRIFREFYGVDWIGLGVMTVTPFLISNCRGTVDAVSFSYDLWAFNCPGFITIKSPHYNSYWHTVYDLCVISIVYGLAWMKVMNIELRLDWIRPAKMDPRATLKEIEAKKVGLTAGEAPPSSPASSPSPSSSSSSPWQLCRRTQQHSVILYQTRYLIKCNSTNSLTH